MKALKIVIIVVVLFFNFNSLGEDRNIIIKKDKNIIIEKTDRNIIIVKQYSLKGKVSDVVGDSKGFNFVFDGEINFQLSGNRLGALGGKKQTIFLTVEHFLVFVKNENENLEANLLELKRASDEKSNVEIALSAPKFAFCDNGDLVLIECENAFLKK